MDKKLSKKEIVEIIENLSLSEALAIAYENHSRNGADGVCGIDLENGDIVGYQNHRGCQKRENYLDLLVLDQDESLWFQEGCPDCLEECQEAGSPHTGEFVDCPECPEFGYRESCDHRGEGEYLQELEGQVDFSNYWYEELTSNYLNEE